MEKPPNLDQLEVEGNDQYDASRQRARTNKSLIMLPESRQESNPVMMKLEMNDSHHLERHKNDEVIQSGSPMIDNEKIQSVSAFNHLDSNTMPLGLEVE
eukprot:CAMPEP_0197018630 /NCGR_PEP_ID=MMETSP1380-20130617/80214_1 /TAXON_ID=5936 /ORGANISM="Euplotes crassus, Strain CT5" /LENGTH=98 /DNA_ID=CAMNT_0042445879 /DNA_START=537 /DNA_END=830 /DNA_ORIENTATION=+